MGVGFVGVLGGKKVAQVSRMSRHSHQLNLAVHHAGKIQQVQEQAVSAGQK